MSLLSKDSQCIIRNPFNTKSKVLSSKTALCDLLQVHSHESTQTHNSQVQLTFKLFLSTTARIRVCLYNPILKISLNCHNPVSS
jgi:hypothetical protein